MGILSSRRRKKHVHKVNGKKLESDDFQRAYTIVIQELVPRMDNLQERVVGIVNAHPEFKEAVRKNGLFVSSYGVYVPGSLCGPKETYSLFVDAFSDLAAEIGHDLSDPADALMWDYFVAGQVVARMDWKD